ncbi:Lipocalin-like domain-containing protein [Colletotrichum higginsianum IMI 349063]|uniref:Lipocalin-like domain-containing protein n=2 Tax=Colletotrichum higginsianum TaxID=80884 RepID=A0A1B7YHD3_COLHI|nr:Lipocalin-like domain-containing protein [Colletotrichum higginsianum IMI 349063]OBR11487.1 Lipocalin-like domain-containing protein [Colletotrichum higginsianum IMI 349063]TIC98821.1 Outer membrane lipoprotein Blc [Colletotrichum higginsianum]GJC93140.1 lipocalin-like domain-containing protein [Colletotrichum higginsianum]
MRPSTLSTVLSCAAVATAAAVTNETTTPSPAIPNVVQSTWDGKCFYPTPDAAFDVEAYLGRWYQVAGTVAPFTAGCKCIYAQYSLNDDGTVKVNNTCETPERAVNILGTAAPADPSYGAKGVLRVQFPGQPGPECAGPNYIVQDYTPDFALVQSSNFSTLFVLSRQQNPEDAVLDAWIARAGQLGSSLDDVIKIDQTDCKFT